MPKAVFFSNLQEGKRDRGAPRNRNKDQLKRHLAQTGISHQSWQQEASDRDSWRSSVRKASCELEAERHRAAKEKRRRQKSEQHPYRPHPKPSSVQSAVGCAHQESVSTATNEHARIDHQPSKQSSSARNEPSFLVSNGQRPLIPHARARRRNDHRRRHITTIICFSSIYTTTLLSQHPTSDTMYQKCLTSFL